ncbi:DNA internalization-related competence protein ComEC/Rec2 [uncultured Gilvimarinus sp.]|uniref:DNA internalization-related competence protein ComEC/Rec2 n=1 Tax=uncultured Gilvimarinus sp. TaxID=1689143 RepID=UPI0030DBE6AB
MYRTLLALLAGVTLPSFLPQLLPLPAVVASVTMFLSAWLLVKRRAYRRVSSALSIALLFLVGFGWGSWSLHSLVANQLNATLEGEDILVTGVVDAPVQHSERRVRMLLAPHTGSLKGQLVSLPRRLQVSWYRAPGWVQTLAAGDRVALTVRLKRPRSFVNPAGFDYKLWQLRWGVGAVGYVRTEAGNRRLTQGVPAGVRATLSAWLARQEPVNHGLLGALLLGERGELSDTQRQLLQATGTSHLIAISGLHIGLAATLGYLLALAAGKLLAPFIPWRAQLVGFAGAAFAAWGYSALAGFSLPTQRALAMLLLLYASRVLARHSGGGLILAAAALLVCTLDPLSVRDAGFWLSFVAVASLVLVYDGLLSPARRWQSLWLPQLVVFLALLVPLGAFFGQVSLVSPVANLLAIPLVSLLVVPLLFAAALGSWLNDTVAGGLLWLADRALDVFWWWLQLLARLEGDYGWPISVDWQPRLIALLLIALGALLLLLPKAFRLRATGVLLVLLALWVPRPAAPRLAMTVMDVGQGLAVVIQTHEHSLVYDAGPRYSDSFDAGADIIAPFLRQQGIDGRGANRLDALVVSHAHADHAGGAAGLLSVLPSDNIYLGEPLPALALEDAPRARSCHPRRASDVSAGSEFDALHWRWHQVTFRFLTLPGQRNSHGNSASCVLLLEYQDQRWLLTGDIERPLEADVVAALTAYGVSQIDVLLAPHHGSKTSSSAAFVTALAPDNVVFSAGFNNRHGHPHPQVVERYQKVGSRIFNTAVDGAVGFYIDADGALRSHTQRQLAPRPWRD